MFFGTIGFVAGAGGFPAAGTLLSTYCEETSSYDANNNYYNGAFLAVGNYADGLGGSYTSTIGANSNGCWYPAGYLFSYAYGDLTTLWSHGGYAGSFTYGYYSNGQASDGAGGAYSFNDSNITVEDNQIVHSYEGYDSMNNWYVNEVLYFDLETASLVTASWPFAGTVLSSACTTNSYTDAAGTEWSVGVRQEMIADGVGGYSYTTTPNTGDCGYWPNGFVTSYNVTPLVIYYYDPEIQQTFTYGNQYDYVYADGSGGSNSSSSQSIDYPAGFIFFSYYDEAGAQTVNYHFDGVNSYYISYST